MNRLAPCVAALLSCATLPSLAQDEANLQSSDINLQLAPTMPENIRIISDGDAEFNGETGMVRYLDGIQVFTDTGIQIFAKQALFDTRKQLIQFHGDVSIYQNSILHHGESASFNYKTEELITTGLKTSLDPVLLDSASLTSETKNGKRVFIGKNASLTTHDNEQPNYWIRAKEIKVYPEEKVILRDLKFYAGDTPIFWLPYFAQSTDPRLGYHFTPGAKSSWGATLLNKYGVMVGDEEGRDLSSQDSPWLLSEWLVDIRSKRGLGTGLNLTDTRLDDNKNLGWFKAYYSNDLNPSLSRTGLSRGFVNEDRYKLELKHRLESQESADVTNLLDINLTYLSDQYYLEDLDPRIYSTNSQPDNTIGIQRRSEYAQMGAFTRFQANSYYATDTRFPEAYLDFTKRPILDSNILHEGTSSIGYYTSELGHDEPARLRAEALNPATSIKRKSQIQQLLNPNRFARLHTYQEFSRPFEITRGITITPRAGAGLSHYRNEGDRNDTHTNPHSYFGLDAAAKFTRRYDSAHSRRWGLNELLHVVQPYTNISVLSTKELDSTASKIDRLTPSERPRPFGVARYTAIDDYRNWSIARIGTRNTLLTRRNNRSHTWLALDTYLDAFMNDPEYERDFSNLYNDLRWDPVPWGQLNLNTQFPISSEGFTEITTNMIFWPAEYLELELGHSYLSNHPLIENSNLVHLRSYFRLNRNWGIGSFHQWQLEDNTLERQTYSINRNFESWTVGFGLFQRDNRLDQEYGAILNLSLNALPSLNLPVSLEAQ